MKKLSVFVGSILIPLMALFSCQKNNQLGFSQDLNSEWKIQSSDVVNEKGSIISSKDYQPQGWYSGNIPATVMAFLRQNGEYSDIFTADNIGHVDKSRFKESWWYRKEFILEEKKKDEILQIRFEGINYQANLWLNGELIADSNKIEGVFNRWKLDVTKNVSKGTNVIVVEIFPPESGDLTIGFVDWNPPAPDNNMGLWRGIELIKSKQVSVESPMVTTHFTDQDLSSAELTARVFVTNHSNKPVNTKLVVELEGIGKINQSVTLDAFESRDVIFSSNDFHELKIADPKIWWPNNLGDPNLNEITVQAFTEGKLSHQVNSKFGIREIEQYINKEGYKGWMVNGQPLIIKGAGWVDDLFLSDSDEKVKAQLDYVQHMNLNCIRLEGFWGNNKTLYEAADERGILVMVGWSCQWEWEGYCGRPNTRYMNILSKDEIENHTQSYFDQVLYLREHPSVFLYVLGSDKLVVPDLERKLEKSIRSIDDSRPILSSCQRHNSEISGPSGVKMFGPYGYVPPVFWYVDTTGGGAYGFNTETGPGPQVPPLESLERMIPKDQLWPINETWNFHCGRNEFNTLDQFMVSFIPRYGELTSLNEFVEKAQISNYEAIRPMFEAFQVNRYKSTGVIQWMLNSAWPEMYWQLYDYYLVPNGAFYGTRKACQPLNPIYNYKDKSIYVVNDFNKGFDKLLLKVKVLDIHSKTVFQKEIPLSLKGNCSEKIISLPEFKNISTTYFVKLELWDTEENLADNFYWLSAKEDTMDYVALKKLPWRYYTPQKEFADFTELDKMPKVEVDVTWDEMTEGEEKIFKCNLKNDSDQIAFFIETAILDKITGRIIVPVLWDDNYISLLPGEERVVEAKINATLIEGKDLDFRVNGWNLKKF